MFFFGLHVHPQLCPELTEALNLMVMPSGTKVATEGWWMDSYSALAIGFGAISRIQQMELRKRTIFQDIRPYVFLHSSYLCSPVIHSYYIIPLPISSIT